MQLSTLGRKASVVSVRTRTVIRQRKRRPPHKVTAFMSHNLSGAVVLLSGYGSLQVFNKLPRLFSFHEAHLLPEVICMSDTITFPI